LFLQGGQFSFGCLSLETTSFISKISQIRTQKEPVFLIKTYKIVKDETIRLTVIFNEWHSHLLHKYLILEFFVMISILR